MRNLLSITLSIIILAILGGCDMVQSNDSTLTGSGNSSSSIDTAEFRASIMEYETQPIAYVEVFQVFEEKEYDKDLGLDFQACLVRTYKYNKSHKYKYDEYEQVNASALYVTYDSKVMLYDDLKIYGDDFIMTSTYTYETRGGNLFGVEVPPEKKTVPVYMRRSEMLKIIPRLNKK